MMRCRQSDAPTKRRQCSI
jgi:hypothetical protein